MLIPTESVGSIPRPLTLIEALRDFRAGHLIREKLDADCEGTVKDTIRRFEARGYPVITDGEQTKFSIATYTLFGLANLAPDGVVISFEDGHARQLPRLTAWDKITLPGGLRSTSAEIPSIALGGP